MSSRRILIYGDIDFNVIDGSSIWLQSITTAFTLIPNTSVVLLLKQTINKRELIAPLEKVPNLTIIDPIAQGLSGVTLSPFQVRSLVEDQTLGSFDAVVIRGSRLANEFAKGKGTYSNLWVYLTDITHLAEAITSADVTRLKSIARSCGVVLCQTEGLRSLFEDLAPATAGKTWLLPPMIPDLATTRGAKPVTEPAQLVYAGKYAPDWNTLEMCDLPALAAERGMEVTVTMIGDKIHRDPDDPLYRPRMEQALLETPDVDWIGRLTRQDTLKAIARADIGLSWRSQALSESLELSTKLLEYGAAGVPFVLNRTPDHELLVGHDYPLFAETLTDVTDRVAECISDPDMYDRARATVANVAQRFSIKQATIHLERVLDRTCPRRVTDGTEIHKVLVISHDFKFFDRLEEQLTLDQSLAISRDTWEGLDRHNIETSLRLIEEADTIICEWCGPNAVFASRHKRADQRLIVRLHRFELYRNYPRQVNIDAVDAVIAVNNHYRDLIVSELGWPEEKVLVIPNWVDVAQLDREKIGDVRFHLGMIGIAPPSRKRFDRALDILAKLRRIDDRYTLFIKSKQPWEYPYMWSDAEERTASYRYIQMLNDHPFVNDGVVFDGFGPDVGRWLRRIGYVLSTSDDESFHLSPAEGMASGAVPVIFHWPGAESVYRDRWLHNSADSMVEFIDHATSANLRDSYAESASRDVESISLSRVASAWEDLIWDRPISKMASWGEPPAIS